MNPDPSDGAADANRLIPDPVAQDPLSGDEHHRYARHLILPEIGVRGQERLKRASALIIGAGGLGSPAALYLAAAGVGRIGLVDFDSVDVTNLQRQVLYGARDIGRPKLDAAKERLEDLNPHITIEDHHHALDRDNALDLVGAYDVVIDGTDNFPTRYLVNDASILTGVPNVYGSIFRFEGQASVFGAPGGPCYRCLYATPPSPGVVPSCAEGGVLGVLPGIIGTIQANEALKVLLGIGETLAGRLLLFDALDLSFTTLRVERDPACAVCGDAPTITEPLDEDAICGTGPQTPPIAGAHIMTVAELIARIEEGNDVVVVDVREPGETAILAIPFAKNIPLRELPDRLAEIPRGRPVVLHCMTGARSAQAWHRLREAGFDEIYNLHGGVLAYHEALGTDARRR